MYGERDRDQQQRGITVYGGRRPQQQQRGFFYGGPDKQVQINPCAQKKIPTFEELVKNRLMGETRFYGNNSNTKWLSVGVVPATKILNDEARGFYMEAFLCGDKSAPLPLGGINGIASLFHTIRQLPGFKQFPVVQTVVEPSDNITIESCNFAEEVCITMNP